MANNSPVLTVGVPSAGKTKLFQQQLQQAISSDILDDLASKFIINVPVKERENLIRICFQIELAHWFYLDFYCVNQKPKCGMKQFTFQVFQHIPFLQPHLAVVDKILEDWKQYKLSVPTYGAILISEDMKYVLLVQSFWAKSSWGFPKGKINENEEPLHCAIREVYEETGYDIKNLIMPDEYIELVINYQYTRLYLVCGVPLSTLFIPRTRNEIKCCEWFPIDLLPVTKNANFIKGTQSLNGNSFFMIFPFLKPLKKKLEKFQKNKNRTGHNNSPVFGSVGKSNKFEDFKVTNSAGNVGMDNRQRQRHKSMGEIEQQRSKSSGGQYYNVANQQPIKHIHNAKETVAGKGGEMQVSNAASNKKSHKKQINHDHGTFGTSAGTSNSGGGKMPIKKKLFEVAVDTEQRLPASNSSDDHLAMFNENKAWRGFRLDYSKFF
ncbi:m7GpppN-mRNA hydrolase-like [Toxorhynchites rutilus septentrionalis]|uniref:m7GpppN-mRNA hydrolase-like n=1 Tax=Toxorhynchites rutilus septentrionalis TaxID=329112 RepID=UPI00247ACF31|nr:m7GpppN-mRNA hydrolase-like [Toxorhynchites rutilus septentrionalis]XP_055624782.1 m7GpppN-mRNA hydrolase-like [Toxorhynchites rutilus septentrionalis]